MRKPFYRSSQKCWYVKDLAGKFIRLATSKSEAFKIWHRMLEDGDTNNPNMPIVVICNAFLTEFESRMTSERFAKIKCISQSFVDHIGPRTNWRELTPASVLEWLRAPKLGKLKKDQTRMPSKVWAVSRQRDAGQIIKQIFEWADDSDLITKSPIRALKLPTPKTQAKVVSVEIHKLLVEGAMASSKSRSFAIYLIASHCGARPIQIRQVTAANLSSDCSRMIFHEHKNQEKVKKPLVVYASPCLQTLLTILSAARKKGPLFLNDRGEPWKKDTVCRRMKRLKDDLGIDDSITVYSYRHTFATDALRSGVDIATVATLLGHSSTEMVAKVYGHLDEHSDHLRHAAARASAKRLSDE